MAIHSVRHGANADSNTYSDADADSDSNADSDTNTNTDAHADTDSYSNPYAASDVGCRGCSLRVASAGKSRELGERLRSKRSGRRSHSPYRRRCAESHCA